ncbi:hypothetical protein HGA91_04060 [candidate division WWE3 bacterium]|nr:hypothetical protein [candidate division WWE3 bacterium]
MRILLPGSGDVPSPYGGLPEDIDFSQLAKTSYMVEFPFKGGMRERLYLYAQPQIVSVTGMHAYSLTLQGLPSTDIAGFLQLEDISWEVVPVRNNQVFCWGSGLMYTWLEVSHKFVLDRAGAYPVIKLVE